MTDYNSYTATYCEWCGNLESASDELESELSPPVERMGIREAIGEIDERRPVGETTALEQGECDCGGTVVQRYYHAGEVPEPEYEPDEDEIVGRGPVDDAIIEFPDGTEREAKDIPWLEDGPGEDT